MVAWKYIKENIMKIYFVALFFVFGCASIGTHKVVEASSFFKPGWTSDEVNWTKGKYFYTSGYVSGVYDKSIGERQALLNAYSNLVLSINTKAKAEMQSIVVGDNKSTKSTQRLFRSLEALNSSDVSVFGAMVKDRYWRKIKVKESFGTISYIYDCYILLKLDLDKYNSLVALANGSNISSNPDEFLIDILNKVQNSIKQ